MLVSKFMKMTGSKFLLDTNIIIAWLKGEAGIADKIDKAKEIHLPIIGIGELYYGALYSTHVQKNIKDIKIITSYYNVLLIDEATTVLYGTIKAALRQKGQPIPENDIWIAAIAQRNQLLLITRDKHFKAIENLQLRNW